MGKVVKKKGVRSKKKTTTGASSSTASLPSSVVPGASPSAQLMAEADEALSRFDYSTAAAKMEAAHLQEPGDPEILDALGEVLVTYLGEEEKGKEVLLRSIQLAPDTGHSKYMTVGQLEGGGGALRYYKKGAENIAASLGRPGITLEEKEDLKDVMAKVFCAVAELWTTDLCMEEGAEHQCSQALDFAHQYAPNNPEVHALYAQLHLRLNNIDASRKSALHVLKLLEFLDEERQPPPEMRIEIAKLLMQVNEFQEAYELLRSILVDDDRNGYLFYLMAESLKHMGKYRRSLRHLLRAKGIASRVVTLEDEQGEDGPAAFLQQVDALISDVGSHLDAQTAQQELQRGEDGWVTDSEDEAEDPKQGERVLKQALLRK